MEALHLVVGPVDHWHLDGGNLARLLTRPGRDVRKRMLAAARAVRLRSVRCAAKVVAAFERKREALLPRRLVATEIDLKVAEDG